LLHAIRYKEQHMITSIFLPSCILWLNFVLLVKCENVVRFDDIIEWVISKGGYFSDKVEIRSMGDSSNHFGVFAREDIESKERLFEIPRACYISVTKIDNELLQGKEWLNWKAKDEMTRRDDHNHHCRLARKLMKEIDLGMESEFAPYVEYLSKQKAGQTPATWSKEGKNLLRRLLPPYHDGVDWIEIYFKNEGCIGRNDPKGELAVSMVLQRGFDLDLIPIWDMVNHNNGKVNTEHNSIRNSDRLNVRASKKILTGEEIFGSYDLCVDCGDTGMYWGATEVLRDYGFVEEYPQRWVFYHNFLYFELIEENGELEVVWDIGDPRDTWGIPNEETFHFMQNYLKQLQEGSALINDAYHKVATNEIEMIMQYHKAAIVAFSQALKSLKTLKNNSTKENHDQSQGEL